MKKRNLAFIDLETTGLNPTRQEIIEIGCVVVEQVPQPGRGAKLEVVNEFESKVKPEHLEFAEPEALRINSYNDADWLFAVTLEQAMKVLVEKTEGAIMISHNITFDWAFLQYAFVKTKLQNKMSPVHLDLMSMAFAKLYHDEKVQRFNLKALGDYFGIQNEKAHTAMADIKTSIEIYKKLLEI